MNVSTDVLVIGAGMAGTAAALVLNRQGARVTLVDPRPRCDVRLKAEKITQDQAQIIDRLGLLDLLAPHAGRVREIRCAYKGRVFRISRTEQFGMSYPTMVNALRNSLPKSVDFQLGYVREIINGPDIQRVRLDSGEEITARLVVLASGLNPKLQAGIGLSRRLIRKDQCFVLGFNLEPEAGNSFDFDAVTVYPYTRAGVDYLTIFRFPDQMRGNLFVFRTGDDPWIARFKSGPAAALDSAFPKLRSVIGDYRIAGPLDNGSVNLYVTEGIEPGVVLIGDAFQSACPATGLGMNKIFTDIEVLRDYAPSWLTGRRIGRDELLQYYNDPRKQTMDRLVIQRADGERRAVLDESIGWQVRRMVERAKMRWALI